MMAQPHRAKYSPSWFLSLNQHLTLARGFAPVTPVGTKLLEKLPEKGLIGLGYWEHGYRDTTNSKHPITKWEDMQGLKIRVIQIPIFVDIFNGVGANAVPMPFTELYTALEQKAVDGQETALPTIETSKF